MTRGHHSVLGAMAGGAAASSALVAAAAAVMNVEYASMAMTFLSWFVLGFAANMLGAGTVGLAWHIFAYARGWRTVHVYWAPGAAFGVIVAVAILALPAILAGEFSTSISPVITVITSIIGFALGALTGLFAWLIRRPDRDTAPNPPTSPS